MNKIFFDDVTRYFFDEHPIAKEEVNNKYINLFTKEVNSFDIVQKALNLIQLPKVKNAFIDNIKYMRPVFIEVIDEYYILVGYEYGGIDEITVLDYECK